jgi:hypothetical protein
LEYQIYDHAGLYKNHTFLDMLVKFLYLLLHTVGCKILSERYIVQGSLISSFSISNGSSLDTKIKIRYTKPATRMSDIINNAIASSAFSI